VTAASRRRRLSCGVIAAALAVVASALPAWAHHVGAYTPRDNEVSANFKQIKFSMQARKFDVAERLYQDGAVRKALRARAASLPSGLDASVAAAIHDGRAAEAEAGLVLVFLLLVRDLAEEANRHVADTAQPVEVRAAAARKLLEAVWRYYNLVDFALTQRNAKAATGIRLAFEEAEELVKRGAPAPERAQAPLARIARLSTDVITSSSTARRDS